MSRRLTPNCAEEQHGLCLGGRPCDCTCHEVPAPPDLRKRAGLPPKTDDEEST